MNPIIEQANGTADGANTDFWTSHPYVVGSTRVFLNGLVIDPALDDGWVEIPPVMVRMKIAPQAADVVQVYYLPL